jgi:hypothetical protein
MNPGKAFADVDETLAVGPPATHGECMHRPLLTVASQVRANCQPAFDGLPMARSAKPGAWVGFTTWSSMYEKLAGELNARLNVKRKLLFSSALYTKATRGENCDPASRSVWSPRIADMKSSFGVSGMVA